MRAGSEVVPRRRVQWSAGGGCCWVRRSIWATIGLGSTGCHARYPSRTGTGHSTSMSTRVPGDPAPARTVTAVSSSAVATLDRKASRRESEGELHPNCPWDKEAFGTVGHHRQRPWGCRRVRSDVPTRARSYSNPVRPARGRRRRPLRSRSFATISGPVVDRHSSRPACW